MFSISARGCTLVAAFLLLMILVHTGPVQAFPGEPEEVTIAEARALPPGTLVRVSGVVTRARGAFTYLQDETAGMAVRQTAGAWFEGVADGTIAGGRTMVVEGITSRFRGLFQINEGDLQTFAILAQGFLPEPIRATLSDIAEDGEIYESRLVRVINLEFESAGLFEPATTYTVSDPTTGPNTVDFRVPNPADTELVGQPIPPESGAFTGVVAQFWPTPTGPEDEGYQLVGILAEDIVAQPEVLSVAQFVHNAPDPSLMEVDIYLNGTLALPEFGFRMATPFIELPSALTLAVAVAGADGPEEAALTESLSLLPETIYQLTVIGVGEGDFGENPEGADISLSVVELPGARQVAQEPLSIDVAFVHAAPDLGPVDLTDLGSTMPVILFQGSYGQTQDYVPLAPGLWEVHLASAGYDVSFELAFAGLEGEALVVQVSGFADPAAQPEGAPGLGLLAVFADGNTLFYPPVPVFSEPVAPHGDVAVSPPFPNPAVASAAFQLDLPTHAYVSVDLFDVLGRQVRAIGGELLPGGVSTLELDASGLGAGVYLWRVRVEAEGVSKIHSGRLIVAR